MWEKEKKKKTTNKKVSNKLQVISAYSMTRERMALAELGFRKMTTSCSLFVSYSLFYFLRQQDSMLSAGPAEGHMANT